MAALVKQHEGTCHSGEKTAFRTATEVAASVITDHNAQMHAKVKPGLVGTGEVVCRRQVIIA